MPLENFYEESDKAARHWRKFLGLAFLLLVIYFTAFQSFLALFERDQPQPEQLTPVAERLRRVDALCNNLPKPEQFYFTGRDEPIFYTNATAIVYRYKSDRNLQEIMPAFLVWFGSNDWKRVPESESSFTKGNQKISIKTIDSYYNGNYEIYCYEKSIEFYD